MACSKQSAKDYIANARVHLVGELRNLSVILENLHQQKVLIDEEISKIKAEKDDYDRTRAILDSVIRKGEEACYRFLRIIDQTRSRTLERPTLLFKNSHEASTEATKFDLHHWISCFSFTEDPEMDQNYIQESRPCYRYQAKLKSKAENVSKDFWKRSENLFAENKKPELLYTSLILDIQGKNFPTKINRFKREMCRPKKLRTCSSKRKPEISPSDLLKTDKNILLVGKPGIGKTALSHEILRLWSERDNKELDYMFYIDMRKLTNIPPIRSLEDLLFTACSEPDKGRDEVLQDIKSNSDNVTVILDGVTDLSSSVVEKLDKDLLPDAKIIITCRPDDGKDICPEDWLRVEVKGFSEETIKTYLSSTLGEDHRKVLSNVELLTLCHVPMYALMVAASFSSEDSLQPRTVTEIYINIVRFGLQTNSNKTRIRNLNQFIQTKRKEILSLAEAAFNATERKTVNLGELSCEESCVLSFLKTLDVKVPPTETITFYTFLHYLMQDFFAALWLLKNPDKIREVFQQCLTEEKKHMKHLIPFMCRLLNEKSPRLMSCLIPAEEIKETSGWFFKEMIDTFFHQAVANISELHVDTLFVYQCLFESQSSEVCISFLDKLDYHLDLSRANLDSYSCCAVAYVVTQSKGRKISLNLQDVTITAQGMRHLFACLQNVEWYDTLKQQLWKVFLLSEEQMDYQTLLGLSGNQLYLPVVGKKKLYDRAVKVLQAIATKVNVCLYGDRKDPLCSILRDSLLETLPCIRSLRMTYRSAGSMNWEKCNNTMEQDQKNMFLDLCFTTALHSKQKFHTVMPELVTVCQIKTDLVNTLVDLHQHAISRGLSTDFPTLRPVFQSTPADWLIDLSERKVSTLLEMLKLQSEKKKVELTGCSHDESEMRNLLQCLPYLSKLSFVAGPSESSESIWFLEMLIRAAAEMKEQKGVNMLELLSVCTYKGTPLQWKWCDFLLDLYSSKTETGLTFSSFISVLQSADPAIWFVYLSKTKASMLLDVLKLQSGKKQVNLTGCSHEEAEVRSFLQCLPYISQLSVVPLWSKSVEQTRFLTRLFCAAAEREQQTGETMLEMLASVCRYQTFPLDDRCMADFEYGYRKSQSDFLLDLYSQMKDRETKSGLSLLPSLQSVFQSTPEYWTIKLSERKTSILLEVMKLQPDKKLVMLTDCSHGESEVRSFLQCLPFISQLRCMPRFFQSVCSSLSMRSREEIQQLVSLLQLLNFKLFLIGELNDKTCSSVGKVLSLCGSKVDLILTDSQMSVRGAAVLFRSTTHLHSLRLSNSLVLFLSQWVRRGRVAFPLVLEELSVVSTKYQPQRVLLKVGSSLSSLLRFWTAGRLDLTESGLTPQSLFSLLLHDAPLTLRLSKEKLQQLLVLLHEVQDQNLTSSLLNKVGGDLSSCQLSWELLHFLLQQPTAQPITVNLRKNRLLEERAAQLLPFLHRMVIERPSPSFVRTSIREIFRTHPSYHTITGLLRSLDHVIDLNCTELDSKDCDALLFILRHSEGVKLKLLWSSIPTEGIQSILYMLHTVSDLSVDRNLLLRFIHCCTTSDSQQGAASDLLWTLRHRLDLSCSSCVELPEEDQTEPLRLTAADCRAVSTVLRHSSRDAQLDLRDCEAEDSGLDLLFPVLDRVCLRVNKTVLVQLLSLLAVNNQRDAVRRATSLCRALGGELDLSHRPLDQRLCGALALMLDYCEDLRELDLSHCQLTDQLLLQLITHLHKVHNLDLSHNQITDASTVELLHLVSINPSIGSVRLFSNNIINKTNFKDNRKFEIS
ncbi:uncharacterized protein LOC122827429 isoform X7 [Gambusia affinis]|uniref:uncharacterized protein LOC122827429 isoform X7 n=1 Tax=Gambusia affinis TaxID=33528 RepID=UPI001CDD5894|nr:uncharacterized protein LOC122827429 isoform X7 [Gambusia affinis]